MKISIAIPTYEYKGEGELFLTHLINTITMQTHSDYEVIISDQSINDKIQNLILCLSDPKIIYFKTNEKLGNISYNTNNAIKHCSGDIIKVMHQDDFFATKYALELINNAMIKNPNKKWGATGFDHCTNNTNITKNKMVGACNPSTSFFINDKNNLDLYDENFFYLLDGDFHKSLTKKYGDPIIINDICITVRQHGSQASHFYRDREALEREALKIKFNN